MVLGLRVSSNSFVTHACAAVVSVCSNRQAREMWKKRCAIAVLRNSLSEAQRLQQGVGVCVQVRNSLKQQYDQGPHDRGPSVHGRFKSAFAGSCRGLYVIMYV